ncbi:hypothetical protein HNR73_004228 [Phytomonospora endophytica]|uniref:RNA polymerase sigma factor 70 region 4 type 2 domain-containing protein n=1 Tax=Phytomonospora endophytica TaxID=714109 RepID=A0A841FWK7_9ACTN|nr:hypothetical protein [Phytomonospora endophytica]
MFRLPKRQRAAVALRYLEDLPVEQTAHILNCSTGAVKSLTARGLDTRRARRPRPPTPAGQARGPRWGNHRGRRRDRRGRRGPPRGLRRRRRARALGLGLRRTAELPASRTRPEHAVLLDRRRSRSTTSSRSTRPGSTCSCSTTPMAATPTIST